MPTPFATTPFIVVWETTRACDLACRHCRAAAVPRRDPAELTTDEACALIDDLAAMVPPPHFVLTGGDPLKRPDLVDLVAYAARRRGLRTAITPSATPLVTKDVMAALKEAGLTRWAFSLDGDTAAEHDRWRGQEGSFAITLAAIAELQALSLPVQINTTVSRANHGRLPAIASLVERLGAVLWSLFFLVPVGRARVEDALDAQETEAVLRWLAGYASLRRVAVKTTEAPQWRRVLAEEGIAAPPGGADMARAPYGVADGDGFVFVDHRGDVYPSGFLPITVGNVREAPLSRIYREAPLLVALRDRSRLKGKCRLCEYRALCGGSRARAYAITGDPLESDPYCAHLPDPAAARRRLSAELRQRRSTIA